MSPRSHCTPSISRSTRTPYLSFYVGVSFLLRSDQFLSLSPLESPHWFCLSHLPPLPRPDVGQPLQQSSTCLLSFWSPMCFPPNPSRYTFPLNAPLAPQTALH